MSQAGHTTAQKRFKTRRKIVVEQQISLVYSLCTQRKVIFSSAIEDRYVEKHPHHLAKNLRRKTLGLWCRSEARANCPALTGYVSEKDNKRRIGQKYPPGGARRWRHEYAINTCSHQKRIRAFSPTDSETSLFRPGMDNGLCAQEQSYPSACRWRLVFVVVACPGSDSRSASL